MPEPGGWNCLRNDAMMHLKVRSEFSKSRFSCETLTKCTRLPFQPPLCLHNETSVADLPPQVSDTLLKHIGLICKDCWTHLLRFQGKWQGALDSFVPSCQKDEALMLWCRYWCASRVPVIRHYDRFANGSWCECHKEKVINSFRLAL